MARLFERLAWWADPVARDGPSQMACDEVLLRCADRPVLRVFRWDGPWISLGYFVSWEEAAAAHPGWAACRRWTGGGVVVHDNDFTFALTAPRSEPWARLRPEESYRALHLALAEALQAVGCAAELFANRAPASSACFAGPVRYDVVASGQKIAGGAQRRTKHGLLHQGSLRHEPLDDTFAGVLADVLSSTTDTWNPPATFESAVTTLAQTKYASDNFLRRAPH